MGFDHHLQSLDLGDAVGLAFEVLRWFDATEHDVHETVLVGQVQKLVLLALLFASVNKPVLSAEDLLLNTSGMYLTEPLEAEGTVGISTFEVIE